MSPTDSPWAPGAVVLPGADVLPHDAPPAGGLAGARRVAVRGRIAVAHEPGAGAGKGSGAGNGSGAAAGLRTGTRTATDAGADAATGVEPASGATTPSPTPAAPPKATTPPAPRTGRRAHARTRVRRRARARKAGGPQGRGFLAKAAAVTAGLTAVGSVLGLVRDQILAGYFGAGAATDAFLVAWTVPEFASTLLIEDAMALILVPAFSRALARRGDGALGDPVRALVRGTLPRLTLTVGLVAAVLVLAAPLLVEALAPGLPDPALAVDCTRLTATCVLSFALVGYCSAALRAHGRFLPPAMIYAAYNVGIIGTILVLREPWGVRSAAAGVAVGGILMVLVQAP
ncbi:lipid II flippase MurJ, partial [Streptomyces sp. NPDC057235]|uniref:lipid II flippase MurJ n=1 Tax=Streptomyces sp. NPDC057235 TaxID=3346058 RepID=UPI00362AB6C8